MQITAITTISGEIQAQSLNDNFSNIVSNFNSHVANVIYVGDFSPIDDDTADNSTAVQAAIDYIRTSYNSTIGNFDYVLDFGGKTYRVESSIDATQIRNPGFRMQNGGLYGACLGKIVLDMGGTNAFRLENFKIYGDKTNTPAVGIYYGREETATGTAPISPSVVLQNVDTNGYFSKSSVINFASEVSSHYGCKFINKHRSLTSYVYINCGHGGTLDDYISSLTSDYITIPTAGIGAQSNILHYEGLSEYKHASDVSITISNISQATTATVTVDSTDLVNSELSNGDTIYLYNIAGMTELNNQVYTIANINTATGTFDLSSTDSSGYGAFTSGTVWNQTGPAVLFNGNHKTFWESNYVLCYGNDPIVVDLDNGSAIRDCVLGFHAEANPNRIFNMHRDTSTATIQRLTINLLNTSQTVSDEYIKHTGTGGIRIDGITFKIANMGTAPTNKLFNPVADFNLRNANIYTPLATSLNTVTSFAGFSGKIYSADDNMMYQYETGKIYDVDLIDFDSNATALTAPGIRYISDSYYTYNSSVGAERRIVLQDNATTGQLASITDRINTKDKYAGKPVWNITTTRPVWATGGSAGATWNYSDGTTAHTPV